MSSDGQPDVDWREWLQRWDRQQEGYVPEREARFTVMFDAVEQLLPEPFVALDLACGPGSVSQRLLARFPGARVVAVDMDPVMLALGQGALDTLGGRLRWVEADLASPDWLQVLGETQFDAVISTTALHWLWPDTLDRVYHELAQLVRPGGVFLNGDHLAYGPESPTLARLSGRVLDEQWSDAAFSERGIETAEQWWDELGSEPVLAPLLAARARVFARQQRQETSPGFDRHVAALHRAGFSEVGTIWQVLSNRVLLAVR
ncbi:MAG: class I SAM-dependent methyltransferase [Humibacillus sp.]|nr:class I SAM-dependent methyltransferase [Humibacillus sp.]MDN5779062.1 class I SAM-dependent methyltransferase [Humibacillus sp.]